VTVTLRTATTDDCRQIAEIYQHYVEHTVITFDYESPSPQDWDRKRSSIIERRRPFLVAVEDGSVLGFAYLAEFRTKQAYDWTTEDTIYLRPDATGRGLGSTLLRALLTDLDPTSVRRIIAVIAVIESDASIKLHERAGFVDAGTLRRVGFKHDRWVDCVLMQYDVPER